MTIKVDDLVRSYDFPGDVTNYCYGRVIEVNTTLGIYDISMLGRVIQGNHYQYEDDTKSFTAPLNGLEGIFGLTRGVVKLIR